MKIIIPSFNRPDTIRTHLLLGDFDYYIFVHDQEQYDSYLKNKTIPRERLILTNAPYGVSNQRQWIIDNFLEKDEWYITMDDNIDFFSAVQGDLYEKDSLPVQENPLMKSEFENKISTDRFIEICEEMIVIAEKEKCYNIGFATTPNFFFRGKKYRYVGYVISKVCIRKNVGIDFDLNVKAMDDYYYTAECLLQYGKVMINNFVFPMGKHYEKGGIGDYKARIEKKISDGEYLMKKYPGLFRYKLKSGCDPKAELAIRFTSLQQVEKWRFWMRRRQKTPSI